MLTTKKIGIAGLGALTLLAASLPFSLSASAQTQTDGQDQIQRTQGAPPQGGFQGGPPPAGPGGQGRFPGGPDMQRPMGGGGGGIAMDSDNSFLYVVQGNQVFKLSKGDLKVVAQSQLMPMGRPDIRIEGQNVRPPAGDIRIEGQNVRPPAGGGGGGGQEAK